MTTEHAWRPMHGRDVDGVVRVAASAFPDHFEAQACFEERLALFPQGCFVLEAEDEVQGYLIAYPWRFGEIPPLDTLLGGLPQSHETMYLHDLALDAEVHKRGLAWAMIEELAGRVRALGARRIALVSVNRSARFWQSMGFEEVTDDPTISAKLRSYGDGAMYMIRPL